MILSVKTIGKCGAACLLELKSCVVLMRKLALFVGNSCRICMLRKLLVFNPPVNFLYFLWKWVNLFGIFSTCEKSIWKKSKLWKQLSDVLETNSLTLMRVLKIFSEIFPQQIWQKIERNGKFKQWFNVFLVISEAWQGYELKAYGVSNHYLKLQCKSSIEPEIFLIFQHKVEWVPHFARVSEVRHMKMEKVCRE